jgi:hypothetical protein
LKELKIRKLELELKKLNFYKKNWNFIIMQCLLLLILQEDDQRTNTY